MGPCDGNRNRISLYLDNELLGRELAVWESHVRACALRQAEVAAERSFLNELRSRHPMRRAPMQLRSRVEEIVRRASACEAPVRLRARIRKSIEQAFPRGSD